MCIILPCMPSVFCLLQHSLACTSVALSPHKTTIERPWTPYSSLSFPSLSGWLLSCSGVSSRYCNHVKVVLSIKEELVIAIDYISKSAILLDGNNNQYKMGHVCKHRLQVTTSLSVTQCYIFLDPRSVKIKVGVNLSLSPEPGERD